MPRKLDFSKIQDISLEDSQETTDVQSIVNNLISNKKNNDLQLSHNKEDNKQLTHVLTSIETPMQTSTQTSVLLPTSTLASTSTLTLTHLKDSDESLLLDNITIKDMARWHTQAEQKVYKAMNAETKKQGVLELYFSFQQLSRKTGFQNRRTIIAAINGLTAKKSIEILIDQHGDHHGRCYRVFTPKEIIERRKNSQIQIHPQTKKILVFN